MRRSVPAAPTTTPDAAVSGANEVKILQTITFPLLRPTMMSVGFLLFLTIARELSASVLLYGAHSYTLPLLTWEYLGDGVVGAASALAVVQVVWVIVVMIVVRLVLRHDFLTLTRSR